ncbi:CPCC family cysteine-rich protein [Kosakonia pseudosacchari]|uniref:Cysteine-rich CPCC domain-containing protein n=1 Tax=Kosakonia pseudosacchari TaxID=1646340 RepID=A0ABX4INK7_9ENTR|nr:hypothetical protein BK796_14520 [Kosakonia pseudosacchari]
MCNACQKGQWEICPVCHREDDPLQENDPDFTGGANVRNLPERLLNRL